MTQVRSLDRIKRDEEHVQFPGWTVQIKDEGQIANLREGCPLCFKAARAGHRILLQYQKQGRSIGYAYHTTHLATHVFDLQKCTCCERLNRQHYFNPHPDPLCGFPYKIPQLNRILQTAKSQNLLCQHEEAMLERATSAGSLSSLVSDDDMDDKDNDNDNNIDHDNAHDNEKDEDNGSYQEGDNHGVSHKKSMNGESQAAPQNSNGAASQDSAYQLAGLHAPPRHG